MNIVIFGAPGSGKGTQSQKIIEHYGLNHISTGQLLRRHIKEGTELGKIADSFISNGNLIPDSLMIEVLEHHIDSHPGMLDKGIIFDGFPRTIPQAEELKVLLAKRGTEVHGVIGLEVPEEELISRMIERGKREGRADDTPETIANRLKVYDSQTAPLQQYYTDRQLYMPVNGNGDVDSIFAGIKVHLDKLK